MFGLFCFVLAVLASPFKSKIRLEAENAAHRHQLIGRTNPKFVFLVNDTGEAGGIRLEKEPCLMAAVSARVDLS